MKNKRLITSALPYINGIKHLGNLVGSMLPADIYARFSRSQGYEVLYICGTDEHGAPAELAAAQNGLSTKDYCDLYHDIQRSIYTGFNISFDYFGRTSSNEHHTFTQEIFDSIKSNGFIYKDTMQQYFSKEDNRFLPDRYIEGECSKCAYPDARGDQCDGCGSLLNPFELINPRSSISGSRNIELVDTNHLYLDLEGLEGNLKDWLKTKDSWPETVKGIFNKWLKEGLKPRCITRDLDWGVNVPDPELSNKVFYVWFDAPLSYISFTKQWAEAKGDESLWRKWWEDSKDVDLIQFMAKDNVPFHSIFWPAMMMSTKSNWKLANYIKGVNWLTYEGGKFSTSRKKGVFTDIALELYPADYWRYALFSMMPESSDSNFSFDSFALAINKDLADSVGNYVSRLCKVIEKNYDCATLPESYSVDNELLFNLDREVKVIIENYEKMEFRKVNASLKRIWSIGNEYITKKEPWALVKTNRNNATGILKDCLLILRVFTETLSYITPELSEKMRNVYNQESSSLKEALTTDWLQGQVKINPIKNRLVNKISNEEIAELKKRFSGQ